jgi:hypothetical protein
MQVIAGFKEGVFANDSKSRFLFAVTKDISKN